MPGQRPVISCRGRMNHLGLHEEAHDGQYRAVACQDHGGHPCEDPHLPGARRICQSAQGQQRQDGGDQFEGSGSPDSEENDEVAGASLMLERAADSVKQPGAAEPPVDTDDGVEEANDESCLGDPDRAQGR